MEKRRTCSLGTISSLFHNIFNLSLTSRESPITHIFVKCGCSNYFFLNSENLICRGTDISKYFGESLGIRDNESRLYLIKSRPIDNNNQSCLYNFYNCNFDTVILWQIEYSNVLLRKYFEC